MANWACSREVSREPAGIISVRHPTEARVGAAVGNGSREVMVSTGRLTDHSAVVKSQPAGSQAANEIQLVRYLPLVESERKPYGAETPKHY